MIFTLERFRLKSNGRKGTRGYVQFRQFVSKRLGNREQDVGVLLCDFQSTLDKESFLAECECAYEDYQRLKEAEDLLEKLKREDEVEHDRGTQ